MASSGVVKSWRGLFGFVESDDGQLVYIHTSEIAGGRLRVGLPVNFDIEKVEGHENRVKGVNVSGEAVLGKGEKLSDEDFEAEKKRLGELRAAQREANMKEYELVREAIEKLNHSNKVHLVADLLKELKLGEFVKKEERRADPTQRTGTKYTREEFIGYYGQKRGPRMWTVAGKAARNPRGNTRASRQKEEVTE